MLDEIKADRFKLSPKVMAVNFIAVTSSFCPISISPRTSLLLVSPHHFVSFKNANFCEWWEFCTPFFCELLCQWIIICFLCCVDRLYTIFKCWIDEIYAHRQNNKIPFPISTSIEGDQLHWVGFHLDLLLIVSY